MHYGSDDRRWAILGAKSQSNQPKWMKTVAVQAPETNAACSPGPTEHSSTDCLLAEARCNCPKVLLL